MPRRPSRDVPTLIIPGWQGSGEGHWQRWLSDQLRDAGRVVRWLGFANGDHPGLDHAGLDHPGLDHPGLDRPDLADWLSGLRAALADVEPDRFDVVAHSLGAVLWLHHVAEPESSPRPARVMLVAPPSPSTSVPEIAGFFPPPLDVDALRRGADGTVLVAGDDDPYIPEGIQAAYGLPLKIATTVVTGGGHLNVESGYGPWPAMYDWCNREHLAFY